MDTWCLWTYFNEQYNNNPWIKIKEAFNSSNAPPGVDHVGIKVPQEDNAVPLSKIVSPVVALHT